MADNAHLNNVPMQGQGQYKTHSALQHEAMLKALPLLQKAADMIDIGKSPTNYCQLTVIEYGSAHGNNS